MLNKLLKPEVKAFIKKHEKSDINKLLFAKNKYPEIPMDLVVNQIRARAKAKNKLPLWYSTEGVIMPPLLSMEQSSSEQAAQYKSELFTGELAIDLTGGAGVDSFYLSKHFTKVIYIDQNKDLAEVTEYNFGLLGANNIEVINANSEEFIAKFSGHADLIYIDPARRDQNNKLFLLEDCLPNIIALQEQLLHKSDTVMVKASPMLDITKGIGQLNNVNIVHIVAIKNEVKELLFVQSSVSKTTTISTIDLGQNMSFGCDLEDKINVAISKPLAYLYEPNAAILKSGKADVLAYKLSLNKLNSNTNLFTSDELEEEFPGRVFRVVKVLKYDKKELKKSLPQMKANISVRNFPDSVDKIRKKTRIKTGGNTYLFAIRNYENRAKILVCSKI